MKAVLRSPGNWTAYVNHDFMHGILQIMKPQHLEQIRAAMAILNPDLEYYATTLTGSSKGELFVDIQTAFDGWGDLERRTEIRNPSLVKPEWFIDFWTRCGEGFLIVKND